MDHHVILWTDKSYRISLTMTEEEAVQVLPHLKPTLDTPHAYDRLHRAMFDGLRSIRQYKED